MERYTLHLDLLWVTVPVTCILKSWLKRHNEHLTKCPPVTSDTTPEMLHLALAFSLTRRHKDLWHCQAVWLPIGSVILSPQFKWTSRCFINALCLRFCLSNHYVTDFTYCSNEIHPQAPPFKNACYTVIL